MIYATDFWERIQEANLPVRLTWAMTARRYRVLNSSCRANACIVQPHVKTTWSYVACKGNSREFLFPYSKFFVEHQVWAKHSSGPKRYSRGHNMENSLPSWILDCSSWEICPHFRIVATFQKRSLNPIKAGAGFLLCSSSDHLLSILYLNSCLKLRVRHRYHRVVEAVELRETEN